jgi:hypothetical protein
MKSNFIQQKSVSGVLQVQEGSLDLCLLTKQLTGKDIITCQCITRQRLDETPRDTGTHQ